ncbi:MAG: electron transfer flavoprotein subunit beta/FixA family protein [bacterium]|nr:electron transfer flavoprotein subunit beta/FixA family protein [bacterium]
MKILVPVKRVIDPDIPVRIDLEGKNIVSANQPHALNSFDEVALAKAAMMRADNVASEMIAVSIGGEKTTDTLRTALAMGADRAIHIVTNENQTLQPFDIAGILAHIFRKEQVDLVLLGKLSVDSDAGQTPSLLAGFLNLPLLPDSFKIDIEGEHVIASFDHSNGQTRARAALPAIVSCELHLVEPRPVSLSAVMKARQKPIVAKTLEELPIVLKKNVSIIKLKEPISRPACQFFDSALELAVQLRTEGLLK